MKYFFSGTIFLCGFMLFFSCSSNEKKPTILTGHMSGYSNETRERKLLRDELREISGMVFLNDGYKIAAVNDEEGRIFIFDYSNKDSTTSFYFSPKGDFEEITMDEKYFYVLESRGRIYRVPKPGVEDTVTLFKMNLKNADFEAMYMDSARKRIVLICKNCPEFEREKTKPAFCFDLETETFSETPCFSIDVKRVRKLLKNNFFAAKPSAAAIHPKLNKLFIVTSQDGRGLLICDLEGNVEQAIYLAESLYPQPESITFAPNGDMYIANEGLYQSATIIRYPFKK
jgi:hypothetical protein